MNRSAVRLNRLAVRLNRLARVKKEGSVKVSELTERLPDLGVEAAAVHVDEDDGDILVAGLAEKSVGGKRANTLRASVSDTRRKEGRQERKNGDRLTDHLVNALPSLERLRTVASTRFLVRAALPVDLPPAMDGLEICWKGACLVGRWRPGLGADASECDAIGLDPPRVGGREINRGGGGRGGREEERDSAANAIAKMAAGGRVGGGAKSKRKPISLFYFVSVSGGDLALDSCDLGPPSAGRLCKRTAQMIPPLAPKPASPSRRTPPTPCAFQIQRRFRRQPSNGRGEGRPSLLSGLAL